MAAIETLPADQLPDPAVTKRAAEWEQTFQRPALTNLAERHWENQATLAHAANATAHADAAFEEYAKTNQTAQNYLFKARELPMKLKEHEVAMQERLMDLRHKELLQPLEIEAKQAAINAARRLDLDRVEDAKFKANLATQEAEGNSSFRAMITASGAKRGTPQYAEAVATAREANPNMNHAYFQDVWSSTGSKLDGDAALETYRRIKAAQPEASVSVSQNGVTMHGRPAVDTKGLTSRLTRLESMRQRAADDEQKAYFTEQITETKAKLSDTGSQPQTEPGATSSPEAAPQPAADPVSDSPDTFKAAFAAAKPGTTLTFRGKTYRKP